jgi:hypothetical protein
MNKEKAINVVTLMFKMFKMYVCIKYNHYV